MGKGKALVVHLLAIAAGWWIVAVLRPVVGSWQGGGEASAESRAPSKTGRIRSTAEIAAGQKLLQGFTDERLKYPSLSPPGPELSFEELLDHARAVALLQPLPTGVATDTKYESLGYNPSALTPDTAFAVLSSIPPPSTIYEMFPHQSAWESATEAFHRRYGSDYHPWLEQLPAGSDRDQAAVALLSHLQKDDLPGYRRIRALVAEPGLLREFPPR